MRKAARLFLTTETGDTRSEERVDNTGGRHDKDTNGPHTSNWEPIVSEKRRCTVRTKNLQEGKGGDRVDC